MWMSLNLSSMTDDGATNLVDVPEFIFDDRGERFQLDGAFLVQRFGGESQVIGFGQRAKVEVVFGVDRGRHVDVELKKLKELTL